MSGRDLQTLHHQTLPTPSPPRLNFVSLSSSKNKRKNRLTALIIHPILPIPRHILLHPIDPDINPINRKHHRRIIQQIPLRRIPPIPRTIQHRRDPRADRTQNNIHIPPQPRILSAIRLALARQLPHLGDGQRAHERVLGQDEARQRAQRLAGRSDGGELLAPAVGEVERRDDAPRRVVAVRRPVHDLGSRDRPHLVGDGAQGAGDGRVRAHDAVVPEDGYFERLGRGGVVVRELAGRELRVVAPRERQQARLAAPGLGGDQGFHEELEAGEAGAQRADHRHDVLLALHGRGEAVEREAVAGWAQAVDAAVGGWAADAAADVGADAEAAAAQAQQRALAAGAAARGQLRVERVRGRAVEVRGGLEVHEGLRLRGAGVEDRAGGEQDVEDVRV